jgi:hypothetical protein
MLSLIRRLFKKDTKHKQTSELNALREIENLSHLWMNHSQLWHTRAEGETKTRFEDSDIVNNDLVKPEMMQRKIQELYTSAQQLQFFLGQYETNLRCLYNWVHTPPPGEKTEVTYEKPPKIAESDLEYLEMLEKARKAQNETRT